MPKMLASKENILFKMWWIIAHIRITQLTSINSSSFWIKSSSSWKRETLKEFSITCLVFIVISQDGWISEEHSLIWRAWLHIISTLKCKIIVRTTALRNLIHQFNTSDWLYMEIDQLNYKLTRKLTWVRNSYNYLVSENILNLEIMKHFSGDINITVENALLLWKPFITFIRNGIDT